MEAGGLRRANGPHNCVPPEKNTTEITIFEARQKYYVNRELGLTIFFCCTECFKSASPSNYFFFF